MRLFVERARLVQPNFDVTPENADSIVEICQRLDGLPLAIELAAARARHLTPQALLARFDRRLDVLSRGQRDLPARQQTMRDTIAWSYDLLDATEQRLFTGLSIFVGGATLDACEEILESPGIDQLEVLESLADKSLLRFVLDEESRVSMLETIRDFARERLEESGDLPGISRRHAEYFLTAGGGDRAPHRRHETDDGHLIVSIGTRPISAAPSPGGETKGTSSLPSAMGGALWRFWRFAATWRKADRSRRALASIRVRFAPGSRQSP